MGSLNFSPEYDADRRRNAESNLDRINVSRMFLLLREDIDALNKTISIFGADVLKMKKDQHMEIMSALNKLEDVLERALKVEFESKKVAEVREIL